MFVMILILILMNNVKDSKTDIKITSGIYIEKLPNVTFYQNTRQIIFKIRQPQNIIENLKCKDIFCTKYKYICQAMTYDLNYFQKIQASTLEIEQDILLSDGLLFDFQLITRNHIKKMFSNDFEINGILKLISERDHAEFREIKFPSFVREDLNNISCIDPLLLNLVLLELQMRHETSKTIVNMCQQRRLPVDLVPIATLERILQSVNIDLTKRNYVLALGSTSQIYMLPLIECIMSQNIILVGLHLPLLPKYLQGLHMMNVITPAYAWGNYTCSVDVPVTNIALLEINSTWKIFIPRCDPIKEEICYISDYHDKEILGLSCIQQVLNGGSFKQFATNCPIICRETGNNLQYITPISSHNTIVTHPRRSLRLKCSTTTHNIKHYEEIGAISLNIPCHCQLEDDDFTIYPTYPCIDKLMKYGEEQLIPAAWTRYGGLSLPKWQKPTIHFETLNDCLEPQWIHKQFPTNNVPISTYILIVLFLLILILFSFITYTFYTLRNLNIYPTLSTSFHKTPTTTLLRANSPKQRRQLPTPRSKLQFQEVENEYLEPTSISSAPVSPTVQRLSTTDTPTKEEREESHYVTMQRLQTNSAKN